MAENKHPDELAPERDVDERPAGLSASASGNPLLEALEPRMLFSAEPFGFATDLYDVPTDEALADSALTLPAGELVLINDNVGDLETLIADLRVQAASGRDVVVHLLDSSMAGVAQVGEILSDYDHSFTAIHFVSHGNDSGLQLGGSWIDRVSLDSQADAVSQWQQHLLDDASLLFYGCDLAASEHGVALLAELAALTGASVAASDDATGHDSLQGDWDLEYRSDHIAKLDPVLSDQAQDDWLDELSTFTYRNGDASEYSQAVDTTLSESTANVAQGEAELLHTSQATADASQALLRFDGILADFVGDAAAVTSATLALNIDHPAEPGATASLYPMLQGWDEHVSWSGFDGGVATDDVEASSTPVATFAADTPGMVTLDVTASVQAWLNGDVNHGWVVIGDSSGSELRLHASDSTDITVRPLLTIVQGNSLTVTTTADTSDAPDLSSVSALLADPGADGEISLREAVIATNKTAGSDTIYLPAGRYEIAQDGNDEEATLGDLDILDELNIFGAGNGATVIDANEMHRHFDVRDDNGGARLNLGNLSLVDGNQNDGGALSVATNSTVTLSGVVLADNTTGGSGGAVHSQGTLSVSDSTFERNTATSQDGGAIFAEGKLSIADSRFHHNEAKHGGAIQFSATHALEISNTDFFDNTANAHGGALDASSGTVAIFRSAFHSNDADKGGAINVDGSASTSISHSTISANTASAEGAGIRARGGGNTMDIESSTIAFNDAGKGGGYDNNGDVQTTIGNSIFEGNTENSTTANAFRDTQNIDSDGYNIVSDNSSNFSQIGDLTDLSARLQSLQYVGESNVASHALHADSPARDTGQPLLAQTDTNDYPRVGTPDRGASESFSQAASHTHGAPIIDGLIDAQWSLSQSIDLLDYSGDVSIVPNSPGASWRAAWDDTALYLLVEVSDSTPFEDSADIWDDDAVAVYLDPNFSRGNTYDGIDDTTFYLGRNSDTLTLTNDPLTLAHVDVATRETAGGYVKEIAIPWSELGVTPSAGGQMGIELHLNDDADGGRNDQELAWADSADIAYRDPSTFGAIVLEAPVESAGPLGLNHGISINTDGGNNSYFEAPASLMQGLGNHTVQTRFSTTVEQGLSIVPWIDGIPVSYALTADMADGQVHTYTQIWNSDTGTLALYLDDSLLGQVTNAANAGKTVNAVHPLLIGQNLQAEGDFNPTGFFSGTIHDVRVWDEALSASEVSDNLHRQFSEQNPPAQLVAYWRFDRLTGDANDRVVDLVNPGANDMLLKRQTGDGSTWIDSTPSDLLIIDDDASTGDLVAHLSPVDADVVNESTSYSLVDDAEGRFRVVPDTGQLLVADSSSIEGGDSDTQYAVTVRVTDETGQSFERNLTIATRPVNEAPMLRGLPAHDTVFYGAAVVLGNGLLPDDPDLSALDSYDGFEVTLQRDGVANAEDVFSLQDFQSGTDIVYASDGGSVIGVVTQNSGGVLQMQFGASATTAAVRDTLRAITYSNAGDFSVPRTVELRWMLNDNNASGVQGSGGALSSTQVQTVQVRPPNYQAVDDDLGAVLSGETLTIPVSGLSGNDTGSGLYTPFLVSTTAPSTGALIDNGSTLQFTSSTGTSDTATFSYLAGIGDSDVISQWPLTVDGTDQTERNPGTAVTDGPAYELQFDGNDYVEIPNFSYPPQFTLTFDFKVNSLANGDEEVLLSQGDYRTNNSLVVWITGEDYSSGGRAGKLITSIWDSTDDRDGYNGFAYDITGFEGDGQWHNYAIVVQQGVGTSIYLDGIQQDTSSHTRADAPFTPSEPLYVGVEDNSEDGLDYYLQRHQVANLRLIDGFDFAAIQANDLNQYSRATALLEVRNEETLVKNERLVVAEDQTLPVTSAELLASDLDQGPESLTYEVLDPPDHGSLLLDGAALAVGDTFTQQQINELHLQYRHDGSEVATADSIGLRLDDSAGSATDFDLSLDLTPRNDRPVLASIESVTLAYLEGDGAVAISDTIAVVDDDDTDFVSATVSIVSGYQSGQDQLLFADTPAIVGHFDATGGVLTLSSVAATDTASWQAALRSVLWRNDSENPEESTRSIEFSIDDGDVHSLVVSRDVVVSAVNDAPALSDDVLLGSVVEGSTDPAGETIAQLFTPYYADDVGPLAGIAISADTSSIDQGRWQYSTDGGVSWLAVSAEVVSASEALLLDALTRLRFVPDTDFFGATPELTITAVDSSYSASFSSAGRVTDDITIAGNSTPFAAASVQLSSTVIPVGPTDLSGGIALNVDGGNDSHLLSGDGGSLLGGLTAVTMEAQFAIDMVNNRNALISYSAIAGDDTLKLLVRSNGVVDVGVLGHDVLSAPVPALVDGNVHSVAASWDSNGGQLRMYADGVLVHSASGIATGQTLLAGGTLVLGMEQDLPGGGFETSEVFSGTLYDIRLWNDVRSSVEIEADHYYKLHTEHLPDSLVANWQLDGFDMSGQVQDAVSGHVLSVGHASGAGFSASTPNGLLSVSEHATNGEIVGSVLGSAPYRGNDLIQDGSFLVAQSGSNVNYESGSVIGGSEGYWHVDSGNVDLLDTWGGSPLGGALVDLVGDTAGSISQTIATEVGKTYQLDFALSGNFGSTWQHDLRVTTGTTVSDLTVSKPNHWAQHNLLWEPRSVSFVATAADTTIGFASLSVSGSEGALISDVQLVEVDPAIEALLAANPALSYDAGTHKFYQANAVFTDWVTAQGNAVASELNGVAGRLVTIHSDHENAFVRNLAASIGADVFLGATDQTTDGQWYWHTGLADGDLMWSGTSDGSAPVNVYTNWKAEEPNNFNSIEHHAVMFRTEGNGLWNDAISGDHYASIFEWDANAVLAGLNYSIQTDPASAFSIDAQTGEISVADISGIDYETSPSYHITVRVTDAAGEYYDENIAIVVIDSTAPQLTSMESAVLTYTENDGNVVLSSDLMASDANSATIESATVTIRSGHFFLEDSLGFTDYGVFSSTWDPVSGTLTIDGSATAAEWQSALRTVTYHNNSEDPIAGDRFFDFAINDGSEDSNTVTRTATVVSVNDAPVLGDGVFPDIVEDSPSLNGERIGDIFGGPFIDPDSSFAGIAVVDRPGSVVEGNWQYSVDNAVTWNTIGLVSTSAALMLDADTRLQFVPAAEYHGMVPGLTVHGVDSSYTGSWTVAGAVGLADLSTRGFDSPFALDAASIDTRVLAVGPTDLSVGIAMNTDGGNDAYLQAADGGALLDGVTSLTLESQFSLLTPAPVSPLLSYANSQGHNALSLNVSDAGIVSAFVGGRRIHVPEAYPSLLDGQRHSIAFSWDSQHGDYAFYVDGEQIYNGSGFSQGFVLQGAGVLVLGHEQDSVGSQFDPEEVLHGTYHDLRIWNEVRSAAEIAQTYQHKFHPDNLSESLIANWQMDAIDGTGAVADVVSGSLLQTQHTSEPGFSSSVLSDQLSVSERADIDTVVGVVSPHSATQIDDLVSDGLFTYAGAAGLEVYNAGQTIGVGGAWHVDAGNVDLDAGWPSSPLGGTPLDLNGNMAGAVSQTLNTVIGKTYQIQFALTGNFTDGVSKTVAVSAESADGATDGIETIGIDSPSGWSDTNMLWQQRSMSFTATSESTTLRFESVDPESSWYGPVIGDVRVTELPPAVVELLADDPTLTYDGGTGKFYRAVSMLETWTDARDIAIASELNGVDGQLVTIDSTYDNSVVHSLVQGFSLGSFLGADDSVVDGQWYWYEGANQAEQFWAGGDAESGGAAIGGAFVNWADRRPNSGDDDSHHAVMLRSNSGLWNDVSASVARGYVIEWDVNAVLSTHRYELLSDPSGAFAIDGSTGAITLSSDSVLDYETATSHDIAVRVTDARGEYYDEVLTIQVSDVPAPSLADVENTVIEYLENSGPVAVSDALSVAGALQSASVEIVSGYVSGEDVLMFSDTPAITHSWDADNGVLTLNGDAPSADWQLALRSVIYANLSDDPVEDGRQIRFSVDNIGEASNSQSRVINVVAVNDAPLISATTAVSVAEDSTDHSGETVSALFSGALSDLDGNVIGIAIVADASTTEGLWQYSTDDASQWLAIPEVSDADALVLGIDTLLRFVPAADYDGAIPALTVRTVDDSQGSLVTEGEIHVTSNASSYGTSTAFSAFDTTIAGAVTAVFDAPINIGSMPDSYVVSEDVDSALDLSAVEINPRDHSGELTLRLNTQNGGVLTARDDASVTTTGSADNLQITGSAAQLNAYLDDTSAIHYRHGVTHTNGDVADTLVVILDYGVGSQVIGNPVIHIGSVNDAPQTVDLRLPIEEDTPYVLTAGDFSFADPADADSLLEVLIERAPVNGQLQLNGSVVSDGDVIAVTDIADEHLVFHPALNAHGVDYDTFSYRVRDDGGTINGGSDVSDMVAQVSVDVAAVNDAPALSVDPAALMRGDSVALTGHIVAVDPDVDETQRLIRLTSEPAYGSLQLNGVTLLVDDTFSQADVTAGNLHYVHNGEPAQDDAFGLVFNDVGPDATELGIARIVTVTVAETHPQPGNDVATVSEGQSVDIDLLDNDEIADDPLDSASVTLVQAPLHGEVFIADNGVLSYLHNGGESSTDQLSYTVADRGGEVSEPAIVEIFIDPVNDAPPIGVPNAISLIEDTPGPTSQTVADIFTGTLTDVDGDVIGISIVANAASDAEGEWRYSSDSGSNWHPVGSVTESDALVVGLDSLLQFIPASDYHGSIPALTVHLVDDSTGTGVTVGAVRELVDATVRGGSTRFSAGSALIQGSIAPVFDAPVNIGVVPDVLSVIEDSENGLDLSSLQLDQRDHSGDLALRLVTQSGGVLTVTSDPLVAVTSGPDGVDVSGTAAQLNAWLDDGEIVYQHNTAHTAGSAADTLTIILRYGSDSSIVGNSVIDIVNVNDAPQSGDSQLGLLEDTAYTLTLDDFVFSDSFDSPGDELLAIQIERIPVSAQLLLDGAVVANGDVITRTDIANGELELHPAANANGYRYDTLQYRVQDNGGTLSGGDDLGDNIATMTVDVAEVNDTPTLSVVPVSLMRGESVALTDHISAIDVDVELAQRIITLTSAPVYGSVQLNGLTLSANDSFSQADVAAGSLRYVHNGTPAMDDTIALAFGDHGSTATGLSVARVLSIAVAETHPQAEPDNIFVSEGQSVEISVLANDRAADQPLDASSVTIVEPPLHGRVSVDNSGVLNYWHNSGASGTDTLRYTVADSGGQVSEPATVTLSIVAVNDAPQLQTPPVTVDIDGTHESYWQTATLQDGSIVAIGAVMGADSEIRILVSRFDADGVLDSGFGDNGHALLEGAPLDPTQEQIGYALTSTDDGHILIAGQANQSAFVGRLNADGSVDTSFGTEGWAHIELAGATSLRIYDLTVMNDQRIVVAGYAQMPDHTPLIGWLSADGAIENLLTPLIPDSTAHQILLDGSDRLVVAVSNSDVQQLLRVNDDGTLDTSFDGNGIVQTSLFVASDSARPIVLQDGGEILVAGVDTNTDPGAATIQRYLNDGALDISYGTDGQLQLPLMESVFGIAAQTDGRIVVAGTQGQDGERLVIARINVDGTLDHTFAQQGLLQYSLHSSDWGVGLQIDSEDQILLSGADTTDSENWNAALLRLTADGEIDLQFNQHGRPLVTEQQVAVAVSPTLEIVDEELSASDNFSGSLLRLQRMGVPDTDDQFHSVAADLAPLVEGGSLVLNGVEAGAVMQNSSGTLLLQFNASASVAMVNQIAQSIGTTYAGDVPPERVTLEWFFDDANDGSQGVGGAKNTSGEVVVDVTSINDAPTLSVGSAPVTHTEAGPAVAIAPMFSIADAEYDLLDASAQATVSLQRADGANTRDEFVASGQLGPLASGGDFTNAGTRLGTIVSNGNGELQIRFDAGVDSNQIATALRQVAYQFAGDVPPAQVSLQWQFTDGNTGAQGEGGVASGSATSVVSIVASYDLPQIAGLPVGALPYIHSAPAVSIASAIELSDPDSTTLTGASIAIADYQPGVDVLDLDTALVPSVSWDAINGVLHVTGTADLASYQDALRSLVYYSVDKPVAMESERLIWIVVSDDTATSSQVAEIRVALTVPEYPVTVAMADIADRVFVEGSAPLAIVPDIVVKTLDSKNVLQARVQIHNGHSAEDVLQMGSVSGASGTWDADSLTLLITGVADAASYQSLLRGISYHNLSENPDPASRTISISLVSESGESNPLDFNLQPVAVNDAPIATGGTLTLPGSSSQLLTPGDFGFSDPHEGHALQSVVIETLPAIGQLLYRGSPLETGLAISAQDIADGYLRYTVVNPDRANASQEQFEYRVRDSGGVDNAGVDLSTDAGMIEINIAANTSTITAPGAPAPFQTAENTPAGIPVFALDVLPVDSVFSHLTDADFASAAIHYPDINRYDANGEWLGSTIAGWQVVDGDVDLLGAYWGGGPDGGAALELNGSTPGTIEQPMVTEPGAQYRINFSTAGNFRDSDSDQPLRLAVSAGASVFEIELDEPVQWSAQELPWQSHSLMFTALEATTDISFSSLTPGANGAIIADIEVIDVLQYELLNTDVPFAVSASGLVTITGSVDYEAATSYSLDIRVSDSAGRSVDWQVPVEVLDLNESPQLLRNETLQVIAGTRISIDANGLTATDVDDADQDAGAVFYTLTENPLSGVLLLNERTLAPGDSFSQQDVQQGHVSYQHNGDPAAADRFRFDLHDGGEDGAGNVSGLFNIDVREPLEFVVDTSWTLLEGQTITLSNLHVDRVGGFSEDADLFARVVAMPDSIEWIMTDTGATTTLFSIQDIADGRVLLRHDGTERLSANLTLEFHHRIGDEVSVLDSRTIDLAIIDVADAPRGANSAMATDHLTALTITEQQLGFNDTDDGDGLVGMQIAGLPQRGTVELSGNPVAAGEVIPLQSLQDGALVYRPDFQTSGVVLDTIRFRLIDSGDLASGGSNNSADTYSINITVNSNHKPVAQPDVISVEEGGRVDRLDSGAESVVANDSDLDTPHSDLLVALIRAPEHGSLTLNTDGTFSYQHDGGESREDSFSYRVADDAAELADAAGDVGQVDIVIDPRNDAPEAGDTDNLQVVTNELLRIELPTDLFVDRDIDDDLTITATLTDGTPLPAWLDFDPSTGVFSGVPDAYGTLQITVIATDVAGASAETQFEIEIEPLLDAALPAASAAPETPRALVDVGQLSPDIASVVSQPVAVTDDTLDTEEQELGTDRPSQAQSATLLELNEAAAGSDRARLQAFEDLVVKYQRGDAADLQVVTANPLLAEVLELQALSVALAADEFEISSLASQKLDRMKDAMLENTDTVKVRVAGGVAISAGLSVGYIVWLVRGGLLLGSVMSAMPAWRWIDPLPVLSDVDGVAADDDESLQSIVESGSGAVDSAPVAQSDGESDPDQSDDRRSSGQTKP